MFTWKICAVGGLYKRTIQTKQNQTHRYAEQTAGYQMGWVGEDSEEVKYKLVVNKITTGTYSTA